MRTHTKIYNYLTQWLHDGVIAKEDLKEISVELAETLKPQKKVSPLFNPFNEKFQKYADDYEAEVFWGARHGKALNEIIVKITVAVKKKIENPTDENIIEAWDLVLKNLPEFYKASFDLITINNKLDSIINTIRNGKQQPASKADFHKNRTDQQLRDLAKDISGD